jgi:anti-sigma factor RsiW
MPCAESLRVQAHFDGEADAPRREEIERHLAQCGECRALESDRERLRTVLRRDLPALRAPAALRQRVLQALDAETAGTLPAGAPPRRAAWRLRPFWWGAASGLGTAAAAATLAFVLLRPAVPPAVVDDVIGAHVGSLLSDHLLDVVSTDRHTVKPWFAGHTEVSPAVADFAAEGYKLLGGRVDTIDHQRAAVVVYRHGAHVINVFCWSAGMSAAPGNTTRKGYHIAFWHSGDLAYAAVSDTGWDELLAVERLMRGLE